VEGSGSVLRSEKGAITLYLTFKKHLLNLFVVG
jgi:hypothetical protein